MAENITSCYFRPLYINQISYVSRHICLKLLFDILTMSKTLHFIHSTLSLFILISVNILLEYKPCLDEIYKNKLMYK